MANTPKSIIEAYIKAYNSFDIEGMAKDLADDVVFENVSNGNVNLRTEGLAAFTEQAKAATQYFKERKQTIESWTLQDSIVEIGISYQAILAIDLPNGLKVGDTLELTGTSIFKFSDGKIKHITDKS